MPLLIALCISTKTGKPKIFETLVCSFRWTDFYSWKVKKRKNNGLIKSKQ